ncbi:MAG: DNA cytosine methyltransferase [Firmicutes bacterium]|nr:DNA cytosine methyltransferase [Bacillota bacterium]
MQKINGLRVADFFCGGGGFSEGFRQAGFDICFALDIWQPAVDTFKANKPGAKVVKDDIERIANLPDDEFHEVVPDVEVIIGSPPCVAFSNSNKSGGADKTQGVKLLESFLKIVARKKYKQNSILRFWALENVPNIEKYIKNEYTAEDLGLIGGWRLVAKHQSSGTYNSKYYGAPTNRKRFLCGDFPEFLETHSDQDVIVLQRVLDSLGCPTDNDTREITDCNYHGLNLISLELSDHFYEHIVPEFEWEKAKRAKQDKGYMGKMSFPENTQKPARTVMATISSCSRESMILSRNGGGYRLPTVREIASMMSFPIDYRFYGSTESVKYRLVGNAVPPKLSHALAKSILNEVGISSPKDYIRISHDPEIPFVNLNGMDIPQKEEIRKKDAAKFKYHIPYLIYSAYRVELTNHHSNFEGNKFRWTAEIHYSQGKKKASKFMPLIKDKEISKGIKSKVNSFIKQMSQKISTHKELQRVYCLSKADRGKDMGPFELLFKIREFIDKVMPCEKSKSMLTNISSEPSKLPDSIIVGYYILDNILKTMEEKNE